MNKYVEHIIKDLVRDTKIDYEKDRIYFPHSPSIHPSFFPSPHYSPFNPSNRSVFYSYCKEKYGLTEDEIDYVWDQYKSIIKDKLENNEI